MSFKIIWFKIAILIFIGLIPKVHMVLPNSQNFAGRCSRTLVCGVGLCCRDSDRRIIPAALRYFTEIDYWRSQIFTNANPGNCSTEVAREGEVCDSFCLCGEGLYCTPNILCRNCGNICMSIQFINTLVRYYDIGCNCVGGTNHYGTFSGYPSGGYPGINGAGYPGYGGNLNPYAPGLPFGNLPLNPTYGQYPNKGEKRNHNYTQQQQKPQKDLDSNIKVVDNIVQLPNINIAEFDPTTFMGENKSDEK